MFRLIYFFITFVVSFNCFALTKDEEMSAAILAASLTPSAATVFTDPTEASKYFSISTIQTPNGKMKEFRALKLSSSSPVPVIRTSNTGDNFEINFGSEYDEKTVWGAPGIIMDRLSRTGKNAVYTSCRPNGCTSVTPDICKKLNATTKDSDVSKLNECGYYILKATQFIDSAKINHLVQIETQKFNSAMPKSSHIAKGGLLTGGIVNRDMGNSLILTAELLSNCKKLQKTEFESLESPIDEGRVLTPESAKDAKRTQ